MNAILMVDDIGALGSNGHLLYDIPEDKKWFKSLTLGKVVIMGRKTFESLPVKPLPERTNVVITANREFNPEGVSVFHNIVSAMDSVGMNYLSSDVFIIGGNSIYNGLIDCCDFVYIARLHARRYDELKVDTFFEYFDSINTFYRADKESFRLRRSTQKRVDYYYIKDGKRLKSSAGCEFMVFQRM